VSVGHVAREIEASGIPTVVIMVRAFRHVAEAMAVPRAVITRHPMGRPLGAPADAERQRAVIEDALALLERTRSGPIFAERETPYRPGRFRTKESDVTLCTGPGRDPSR